MGVLTRTGLTAAVTPALRWGGTIRAEEWPQWRTEPGRYFVRNQHSGNVSNRRPKGSLASPGLLPRKPWIVPIPETTKGHRLQENVEAAAV
jgi:hypothetical protein